MKAVQNLKRQIAANVQNVCKKFAVQLKPINEAIYHQTMLIINDQTSTTQIERVIFIQGLIYCSNESNSYEAQCAFINQFITPISNLFSSPEFQGALFNVQAFLKYFGLEDSTSTHQSLQVRRQVFHYINLMHAILKSVRNMEESTVEIKNLSNSGFLDLKTNRLKNPAFGSFMKLLEPILALIKAMNMVHSKELINVVKGEYLEMTDAAKTMALGMYFNRHNIYYLTKRSIS